MWKLPLQQKVIKNAEVKSLQQEVQTLRDQEKAREAEVEGFHSEAKNLTDHIQLMQQKLQSLLQSIEKDLLEHVQSDQVEQLVAQAEEVVAEVAKIEVMVQAFQGKVCSTRQIDPEPTSSK